MRNQTATAGGRVGAGASEPPVDAAYVVDQVVDVELDVGEPALRGGLEPPSFARGEDPVSIRVAAVSGERSRPPLRGERLAVSRGAESVVGDEVDQVVGLVERQLRGDRMTAVGEGPSHMVRVHGGPPDRGVGDRAGARTTRSLNTVTVSPRSISGPAASTTVTSESTFARMVAVPDAGSRWLPDGDVGLICAG